MALVCSHQSKAQWSTDPSANAVTAAGTVTLTATAGVGVPGAISNGSTVDRIAHLWASKNSTATIDLYGYASGIGNWALFDQITLARTVSEVQRVEGACAFERVQAVCNAIGASGSVTIRWGFGE